VHQPGVQCPAEQAGVPVFDTMAACMAACSTCYREPHSLQEAEVDTCRCKDALTQEEPANPWAVGVGHPSKELCDVAQIVENRRGRLSRPLSPGDIFSKSYDENQIRSSRQQPTFLILEKA
jgi:hypothetical protein